MRSTISRLLKEYEEAIQMDSYNDEINIIEDFQLIDDSEVLLLPQHSESAERIYQLLHDEAKWSKWINSSAKNKLPPDFYCDTKRLMMEVMRVDDHESISAKGKVVNPTRVRESQMMNELKKSGILDILPNAKPIVITQTDLPTEQDHNYTQYRDGFKRTVRKHIDKIGNYKRNHPGYEVIFFVFDESSAYFEVAGAPTKTQVGKAHLGIPHLWYVDENFTEIFIGSDIDYLIWYTPYKHCEIYDNEGQEVHLPVAIVIDVKNYKEEQIHYDISRMIGVEV